MKLIFKFMLAMGLLTFGIPLKSWSQVELLFAPEVVSTDCSSPSHSNDPKCVGARPAYCHSPSYGGDAACAGSYPNYCLNDGYKNLRACLRPDRTKLRKALKKLVDDEEG